MAFKKIKNIDDVLKMYQLSFRKEDFLLTLPDEKMPVLLREEIEYLINNFPYKASEAAIRETILFPILKEIWKKYNDALMLWANKTIAFDKTLGGMPDYLLSKQSKLGKIVFESPLLAVVEAKKDDFAGGWAQCALEMYTIQKINAKPELPVFGIVTNGDIWEFAQLENTVFLQQKKPYTIFEPDTLYAALTLFFEKCKENSSKV
jgi:hypothetical protein